MYPLLFLLVLGVTPSVCEAGRHENTCDVVPKDLYIEVGSSIEIVCQTSCVRGKIYWTLDNKSIDESLYNRTNSTHAVLSLRNFTLPRATLQCHSNETRHVLGGTTITTYLKPSNLSCFLHYENKMVSTPDRFTCSWEHQVDPSLTINYTVLCPKSSCSNQGEICSSQKKTCTTKDIISLNGPHNFTVKAQSAAWEVTSGPFEFTPLNITKLIHPELSSVTLSSDSLLVRWKIPGHPRSSLDGYKYRCQVHYSKVVNEGTPEWVLGDIETCKQKNASWNIAIEKLESCSNYTVAVRCHLNKGPWSDWSLEKTVLTKLKKSDYKPRLWRKVAEAEKNGVRKVHAMWTEIPSTCPDTFNYTFKQTPYKEHTTGVNYTSALCDNSICDVNQDAHTITLEVYHIDSLFAKDSVYVPAIGESLPEVTDIQTNSTPEGVILLSWTAPAQPISGYMIDYTHNGNQYYWKETKDTYARLLDLLDKTPYNITVTPLFDDKTGHGTQVLQICSREGGPGNVDISVSAGHRSAYVSWSVKPQEACSGEVVSFTIFYGTRPEPELNVTANSKGHHTLKDLTPITQYSAYIEAAARTGTTKSKKMFFETTRFGPHFSRALILCGTLLIILVLSVGLCCAVQWKKFEEKLVPDPGRSSVVLLASSQNMGTCSFEPSESTCDRVYIEEAQRASTSPLDTGCNENPASDQTKGYADPAIAPATDIQTEDPVEPVETQPLSSPGELTQLLSSESGPSSPYRSQSPQETPALKTSKQCKRVPVKQQEKMPPLSVYVSLDMFEQGQGR